MESIEFMQESTFRKGSPMNEIQVGPLKVKYMGESQTMAVPMSGGGCGSLGTTQYPYPRCLGKGWWGVSGEGLIGEEVGHSRN